MARKKEISLQGHAIELIKSLLTGGILYRWMVNAIILLALVGGGVIYYLQNLHTPKQKGSTPFQFLIDNRQEVVRLYTAVELCHSNLLLTVVALEETKRGFHVFIDNVITTSQQYKRCKLAIVELPWMYPHSYKFDQVYTISDPITIQNIRNVPNLEPQTITLKTMMRDLPDVVNILYAIAKITSLHNPKSSQEYKYLKVDLGNVIFIYIATIMQYTEDCNETFITSVLMQSAKFKLATFSGK